MASIFSKIISDELPSYKITENQYCLAFLDIFPIKKGHTLVVPKKEIDKFTNLDEIYYQELMKLSKKIAIALEKTIPCLRVGMAIVGLEIPHAHIHLVPLDHPNDIDFTKEKLKFTELEFSKIASDIRKNL
ncbi:MAG: HIT domain-containing protein [Bacteroidota bacterium]|nr:HIT domain-containing protein [Bacteroidota bacterium]